MIDEMKHACTLQVLSIKRRIKTIVWCLSETRAGPIAIHFSMALNRHQTKFFQKIVNFKDYLTGMKEQKQSRRNNKLISRLHEDWKKNPTVLPFNLECFKLITIHVSIVTVSFDKQYSTFIAHTRYKIKRHVSCH